MTSSNLGKSTQANVPNSEFLKILDYFNDSAALHSDLMEELDSSSCPIYMSDFDREEMVEFLGGVIADLVFDKFHLVEGSPSDQK